MRKSYKGRKGYNIDFLRDNIVGKNSLRIEIKLPDCYGKEEFNNANF